MGSAPESLSQFWDERWLRNDQCFRGQWLPQVHDVFCSGCLWVTALLRHYFNVNSADKNAQFWLSVEEFPLQYQNSFILAECICFLSKEGVAYCWRTPVVGNNFQQYWGISTLLNREVFTSLPTLNVRVHSQYFAELSTTSAFSSYPENKIMLTYIICYSALTISNSISYKCREIFKGKSWLSEGKHCKWNSYFMKLFHSKKFDALHFSAHNELVISLWDQFPCLPAICKNNILNLPAETIWKWICFCLASLECWYRTLINVWLISWFKHHSVGKEFAFWGPP